MAEKPRCLDEEKEEEEEDEEELAPGAGTRYRLLDILGFMAINLTRGL